MSDSPFALPPVPMMSPERARDIGRMYQAAAENLTADYPAQAAREMQRAQWWLTYAITLAQTAPNRPAGEAQPPA